MAKFIIKLSVVVLCCLWWCKAVGNPVLDSASVRAQHLIFSAYLDDAYDLVKSLKKRDNTNEFHDFLDLQISLAHYLIQSSEANKQAFDAQMKRTVTRLNKATGDVVVLKFLQTEVAYYSALVNLKAGSKMEAVQDMRQAYVSGKTLYKAHPEFIPGRKTYGMLLVAISALPNRYQKILKYGGMKGDQTTGIALLQTVVEADLDDAWALVQREAHFELAAMQLHVLNQPLNAWEHVALLTQDYATNPINAFARCHIAEKSKRNDEVIQVLADRRYQDGQESIPFLDYLHGNALLQSLSLDGAQYLSNYIRTSESSHFTISTYQKLKWDAILRGDLKSYNYFKTKIIKSKEAGLEKDRVAKNDSYSDSTHDVVLLKTRLLHDGGYYDSALQLIKPYKAKDFPDVLAQTEYLYRKGQLYHQLERYDLALAFFKATMSTGGKLAQYYASYAALRSGYIYQTVGQFQEARLHFEQATNFEANRQYRGSIARKSKAGLASLPE